MTDLATPTGKPDRIKPNRCRFWDKGTFHDTDRYAFDFNLCEVKNGWRQYDTGNDAWYFGIWVHHSHLLDN